MIEFEQQQSKLIKKREDNMDYGRVYIEVCDPLPIAPFSLYHSGRRPAYIADLDPTLGQGAIGKVVRWNRMDWRIHSAIEIEPGRYQYQADR